MIDESMDTEQMKQPVQPWEFRAKPAMATSADHGGGVLFNFILALFIYSMILFTWGSEYVPLQKVALGMDFNETAKALVSATVTYWFPPMAFLWSVTTVTC